MSFPRKREGFPIHLRQIGIATNLYAENWDQLIPRGSSGQTAWYMWFMPFLAQKPIGNDYRTVDTYRCPSYPNKDQTICFVVNGWDFKDRNDGTGKEIITPTRLAKCTRRAQTVYLFDEAIRQVSGTNYRLRLWIDDLQFTTYDSNGKS